MPIQYLQQPVPINLINFPTSSWTQITPTGVPTWATGVAIQTFCHSGTNWTVSTRMTGSSDTWGQTTGIITSNNVSMLYAGLGAGGAPSTVGGGGTFDFWTSVSSINVQAWIVAALDWTFLLNAVQLSSLSSSYASVSASSAVPAGAEACIMGTNKSFGSFGCRATGSTDDWTTGQSTAGNGCQIIMALDSSLNFVAKSNAGAGTTPEVFAYIPSGYGMVWNQNAASFNRTPGTTGSLQALTTPAQTSQAILYQMLQGTTADTYQWQTTGTSNGMPAGGGLIAVGSQMLIGGPTPYCNISASDAIIYEQAYFPTVPSLGWL